MKNEFTVEESNLISIYTEEGTASGLGSRAKVIKSIRGIIGIFVPRLQKGHLW